MVPSTEAAWYSSSLTASGTGELIRSRPDIAGIPISFAKIESYA